MNQIVPHRGAVVVPDYAVSDLERIAHAFAASKLFGVQNVEQALALCLVAQAEGRHPASAAQDYNIIQGRPAKKADAMLRDFLSSGGKVEWHGLTDAEADATFSHPAGGSVRIAWDHDRAKAAGINNPMWRKYPRQMLRSRVVSEGVRTVCPGATSGMYVPEEVQDFAEEPQTATVRVIEQDDFDATPQPRKSAHQARKDGDYERLTTGLRACETEDALKAWAAAEADALGAIPHGWQKELREEWTERRDAARMKAADPLGLSIPQPTDDEGLADYVSEVCAVISGAIDAEQVAEAQRVNKDGLARAMGVIEGVAETVAMASEARLSFFAAKEDA